MPSTDLTRRTAGRDLAQRRTDIVARADEPVRQRATLTANAVLMIAALLFALCLGIAIGAMSVS